uniref:LAM_G_DOMAIN domain-containing protein n=1 Tax=Caenorhabditis tropicalis TaxID=1561998 RepID=A0A1I7TJJ6_9PELO
MNAVVFICIVLALLCRSFGNTDIAPTLSETTAPPSIVIEFANLSSRLHSGINVSAIANHALHYDMVVEVKVSSNELIEFKLYKCRELILGGNIGNKTYILSDSWLVFLFSAGQKPCAFETYDLSLIISSEKNSTGSIEIGTTAKKGFIQHVRNDVNKKIEIDQWFRKIDKRRLSLGPAISTALTNANTTLALITNLTKIPVVRLSKCQSEPITIEIGSKAKTTLSRENMLQIVRLNELICPEDKEKMCMSLYLTAELEPSLSGLIFPYTVKKGSRETSCLL